MRLAMVVVVVMLLAWMCMRIESQEQVGVRAEVMGMVGRILPPFCHHGSALDANNSPVVKDVSRTLDVF